MSSEAPAIATWRLDLQGAYTPSRRRGHRRKRCGTCRDMNCLSATLGPNLLSSAPLTHVRTPLSPFGPATARGGSPPMGRSHPDQRRPPGPLADGEQGRKERNLAAGPDFQQWRHREKLPFSSARDRPRGAPQTHTGATAATGPASAPPEQSSAPPTTPRKPRGAHDTGRRKHVWEKAATRRDVRCGRRRGTLRGECQIFPGCAT